MSADNGTYILQTEGDDGPEFRVIHCQAIDNIYGQFIEHNSSWLPNPDMMIEYFGSARVFDNLEEAWDYADVLDSSETFSEDGSCLITEFSKYHFSDFIEQSKVDP